MSIELLLSDLHFGKKTATFNLEVARARLVELADVLIQEIENESKIFNVENVIIALMGDIIESYTMHGLESAVGCEFGNSEQITYSTISLFEDILSPVFAYAASKGINVKVVGVTGNHDRTQEHKSFSHAAKNNVTWIIYNILMLLSNKSGYNNVVWDISEVNYSVVELYGNTIVY
jgi:predicted phosphodiesterase